MNQCFHDQTMMSIIFVRLSWAPAAACFNAACACRVILGACVLLPRPSPHSTLEASDILRSRPFTLLICMHAPPCCSFRRWRLQGCVQLIMSQLPNLEAAWWASAIGAFMSFGYSFLAIGLGASEAWRRQGSLTGRPAPPADKAFGVMNSLGNFGL